MSAAATTEIETTEDQPSALFKERQILPSKSHPNAGCSREKIDVKRQAHVDQRCGSRGRELIKMLRSDSDKKYPETEPPSFCKKLKNFTFSYAKQWTTGFHFRIIFASHLVFWMSLLPGIAFGSWLQLETDGGLGIIEVLVGTSFCGLVFGIFGTQPLIVFGVSVPSLIFMVAVSQTAKRLSLDFVPWLSWIGLWSSLLLLFLAASGACRITTHLTIFSWEILRLFVGFSLLWIGVMEIVRFFSAGHSLEASLLSLWLATCTLVLAVALNGAKTWRCLNAQTRDLIQNYGPALTFFIFTVLPLLPKFQHIHFERVDMPDFLYHSDKFTKLGTFVRLKSVPMWAILLAFIPGALLACMIFVDHSATSVVLKHADGIVLPEKMPRSWDLFIISLLACVCSLFGMPFCYGLPAQSIAHKRALIFNVNVHDEEGQQVPRETINSQRVSVIIVSLLCGIPLIPGMVQLLEKIPVGVIAGMFFEMAYTSLKDLKSVKRLKVFFTVYDRSDRPSICQRRIYCTVQILCALVVFSTSRTPGALVFPLFILLIIFFRHYVLLRVFTMSSWGSLDLPLSSSRLGRIALIDEVSKCEVPVNAKSAKGAHVEIESSSSPHSRGSPSMLIMPSTRRLKERSRRRNKRKRQTSGLASRTEDDQEQSISDLNMCYSQVESPSLKVEDAENNKDSSGVFGRCKRRAVNIELHSNLLYDQVALPPEHELDGNVCQSPTAYESSHRPSPASSQVNGYQQHASGGSNSSLNSNHSNKRKLSSAVFSTTQNPCFVQAEDVNTNVQRHESTQNCGESN